MTVGPWKMWIFGMSAILFLGFALTEAIPGNPLDRLPADSDMSMSQGNALQQDAKTRWIAFLGLDLPPYPISIAPIALTSWPHQETKTLFAQTAQPEVHTSFVYMSEKWQGTDTLTWLTESVNQGDTAAFFHWCQQAQLPIPASGKRNWTWFVPSIEFHANNRFFRFLWGNNQGAEGLINGDLGISYATGQPVRLQFSERWWHSVALGLLTLIFSTFIASFIALKMAFQPQFKDKWSMFLLALSSVPTFLAGTILLLLFANPDVFSWFPSGGMEPPGGFSESATGLSGMWSKISYWMLPTCAMSYGLIIGFSLPWTQALEKIIHQPFYTTARAKGLSPFPAFFRHALPHLLPLMITMITQALPVLIGGSVIIETLFTWPGLGKLTIEALFAKDQPVLVAMLTFSGMITLTAFLGSNLLQKWLDPRISSHG